MKRHGLIALGELLVDLTPDGQSANGMARYSRNPGGAPANVAVAFARLGGASAFIGAVGDDPFGRFLRATLEREGVSVEGLVTTSRAPTTLAVVSLDDSGEREFSFYRQPGADLMLEPSPVLEALVAESDCLHCGSLSLAAEPARSATLAALDAARKAGTVVSYDPNLRKSLWKGDSEARNAIVSIMPRADILKVSSEELEFVTGEGDIALAVKRLRARCDPALIFVTEGESGSRWFAGAESGTVGVASGIKAVDATGAGDSFIGGCLFALHRLGLLSPARLKSRETPGAIREIVRFGTACAGHCVALPGAIPALPSHAQAQAMLERVP